jgi:hypothetical protein
MSQRNLFLIFKKSNLFDPKWCQLIGGSVGIKVNDDIDHYF